MIIPHFAVMDIYYYRLSYLTHLLHMYNYLCNISGSFIKMYLFFWCFVELYYFYSCTTSYSFFKRPKYSQFMYKNGQTAASWYHAAVHGMGQAYFQFELINPAIFRPISLRKLPLKFLILFHKVTRIFHLTRTLLWTFITNVLELSSLHVCHNEQCTFLFVSQPPNSSILTIHASVDDFYLWQVTPWISTSYFSQKIRIPVLLTTKISRNILYNRIWWHVRLFLFNPRRYYMC